MAAPFISGALWTAAALHLLTGAVQVPLIAAGLGLSVFAAVHHAETVAHRVGEPYGTLVLAVAVTLIEVALVVSLMLAGGTEAVALARDTVFAAVMIIVTGIIGLCLLVGGILHREQTFGLDGVSAALVTLGTIVVLTLVFPNYTTSAAGPFYSPSQLMFIALVSLVIYAAFIFTQTVGHRQLFVDDDRAGDSQPIAGPGNRVAAWSGVLLLACLAAVVLLAKKLAPSLEAGVARIGAPDALVGVIIAGIVLLPEGFAAVKAAHANRLQTSLNLALGSALASIGLTIPTVSVLSLVLKMPLMLGIDAKSSQLLYLSLFVAAMALRTGRTIVLHGVILLVLFAVYVFTIVVP